MPDEAAPLLPNPTRLVCQHFDRAEFRKAYQDKIGGSPIEALAYTLRAENELVVDNWDVV